MPASGNGLNVPCGWRRTRARHGGRLHRAEDLAEYDRSDRWVYALSKAAQERIVLDSAGDRNVRILRIANLFGVGQDRVIAKLVRALKHGGPLRITDSTRTFASIGELASTVVTDDQSGVSIVGRNVLRLTDLCHMLMEITGLEAEIQISDAPDPDACGIVMPQREHVPGNFERDLRDFVQALDAADDQPLFEPSLPVVIPPRPERPEIVAARQQEALWTGRVKNGNAWTSVLAQELSQRLKIEDDRELVLTASGTAALRLAIRALLPRALTRATSRCSPRSPFQPPGKPWSRWAMRCASVTSIRRHGPSTRSGWGHSFRRMNGSAWSWASTRWGTRLSTTNSAVSARITV